MDVNDIQGDSEDKKLIAEWEDILWDEGSGTLSIYKVKGMYECEWNDNDEHTWLTMNDLDMAMSKEDLIKALKPLKLSSPDIEEIN